MMGKDRLTIDEIENKALIIGLGLIILLNFLAPFIPGLDVYFSNNLSVIYVSILLIARIIYKKLDEIHYLFLRSDSSQDFNKITRQIFEKNPKSQIIDIFAYDGTKFFHSIEDLKLSTEKIRILLYNDIPELDKNLDLWKGLNNNGSCKQLIIKTYNFVSSFYSISIDLDDGYFGFFNPSYVVSPGKSGIPSNSYLKVQVTGPYPLTSTNPLDNAILEDLDAWFNDIFDNYSELLYDSDPPKGN